MVLARNTGSLSPLFSEAMFVKDSSSTSSPGASSYSSSNFSVGEEVYAYLADTAWWRRANVLAVRNKDGGDTLEYYVHFNGMNRRHDRWLTQENVRSEDPEEDDEDAHMRGEDSGSDYSDESDHEGMTQQDIQEWEKATKVKRIDKIMFGKFLVETWYWSPYPEEYQQSPLLHICEFCLSFFKHKEELQMHLNPSADYSCKIRHPPGDEIYRAPEGISVFEVDGFFERVYCENLCYISKLFLDHKRFDRFDVSNFYFYCVGEWDSRGFHLVGYFSKEKQSTNRNLSCIMLIPCYQRRGFGSFLIELSYELSKITGKVGTPERPLSDLGKRTYLRWWLQKILRYLEDKSGNVAIQEITNATYILQDDIKMTLDEYGLLKYLRGQFHIYLPPAKFQELYVKELATHVRCDPQYLHWTPLILPEPANPNKND
jgi:GNAT superfamily N-acetyltransferase